MELELEPTFSGFVAGADLVELELEPEPEPT